MTNQFGWTVEDWGCIEYAAGYARQKAAVSDVAAGHGPCLFLCEHPPVITLGRLADSRNILSSAEGLEQQGIDVIVTDRGGDVTFHAPGQLVVYPILNLNDYRRDLRWYLNKLEQVAIDLLKDFDILTYRLPEKTGVWFGLEKIVSVGVGVKHWVTFHGLAINVNTDLRFFDFIRPCGLDVRMTSVQEIRSAVVDMKAMKQACVRHCAHVFSKD